MNISPQERFDEILLLSHDSSAVGPSDLKADRTRARNRNAEVQGFGQDGDCVEGGADAEGI